MGKTFTGFFFVLWHRPMIENKHVDALSWVTLVISSL